MPYLPVRQKLPDGTTVWRYFGDRHGWRIIEEIYNAKVYEMQPAFEPRAGETVLDIGAHIGVYAIRAAREVGRAGTVVAVEADPRNFGLLTRNARAVTNRRIVCQEVALWSRAGEVILHRDPSGFGAHSVVFRRGGDAVRVRAEPLDDMVTRLKLRDVSLIKMDVEGAALQILDGGSETLSRWKPRIACAAYHTPDEANRLAQFLEPMGYSTRTREVRLPFAEGPEVYLFATANVGS